MADKTKIQWTDATWNVARGCTKVDDDCKFCVGGDTLILMSNFTQKRIADISIGDEILSIDEAITPNGRKFRTAIVDGKTSTLQTAYEVITDHAKIIASANHKFLNTKSSKWPTVGRMRLNNTSLSYVGSYNFNECSEFKSGYIQGLTEGDGTFRFDFSWKSVWRKESPQCYWRIAMTQMEALLRCKKYLKDVGSIDLDIVPFSLGVKGKHKPSYKIETRSQDVLRKILYICTFVESEAFARGYLSGMFDAEGNMSLYSKNGELRLNAIRICQKKDLIKIGRIAQCLKLLGFKYKYDSMNFTIHGGQREKFRFFQITTPSIKSKLCFNGTTYRGERSLVRSITDVGIKTLYDIQTSTGTFIANGLIAHNCYMYRDGERYGYDAKSVVRTKTVFNLPLKLKEPSRILVSSLTDFFHEGIDSYRYVAWEIIRRCPQHTFQILTKRPERIIDNLPPDWGSGWQNVWLGTSIGHQKALKRYFDLIRIPAFIRFISFEPLHSEIDLSGIDPSYVDWVIIGGESGNETGKYRYRPCQVEWIEKIIYEFDGYAKIFVKQLGTYLAKQLKHKDRHGGDIDEFPEQLKIREYPL